MKEYLTTAEAAARIKRSEEWVREHAAELGGSRPSESPRGPLTFRADLIDDAFDRCRLQPPKRGRRSRPGPSRKFSGGVELIPLPESVR